MASRGEVGAVRLALSSIGWRWKCVDYFEKAASQMSKKALRWCISPEQCIMYRTKSAS